LGRHASISGSSLIQCASESIALSSFQEGRNARHDSQFKLEQALMSCPPLVLHAERGGSIVETGYAQKNDFRPFGNFSQGLCDLLGFGTLLGPPSESRPSLGIQCFRKFIADKADQILAYCLKCIGLSNPNNDRELG